MKDAEKFRLSLQQKVPRPEQDPAGLIEAEIQRANDRFKGQGHRLEQEEKSILTKSRCGYLG